jgi:hypothetical protein
LSVQVSCSLLIRKASSVDFAFQHFESTRESRKTITATLASNFLGLDGLFRIISQEF